MRGRGPIGPLCLSWLVWTFLLLFFFLIPVRPALAQEAGQIVSVLGAVEIMREGRWQPLGVGETLKVGEVVRTREDGRVAIQLANGSQLKINANSHLELKQITLREGLTPTATHRLQNILRVMSGEVWIRNSGEPLEIQTVPVTATIRGTEFNLAVGPSDFARLAVLDGLVEFSNPQGSVLVAANEQATAKLGEPPRKTVLLNPLDAVQWSLYYPDPAGDRVEREQAERADPRSPRYWTWAARQHLLRGQVPEARRALDRALALASNDARAHALRAAVALVQNRKAEARADAERAVAADPAAPEAHLALSWVQQAEFDLDGALASARRAVALDPDDPQALIQESRLLFGMGRTREAVKVAEKARQRAPKDALVNSTWGFLQLARGRVEEASQAFQEAIAQDSTLGEPHLGLGLVRFRRNQTEEAVEEMRKATLLEPKAALYNSYLGKAYYEAKNDRLAQKYLAEAKQLDPRDPTPYFYDAIRLQSVNRPLEAVQDLQKSIELNDNRAVYRSNLLLDEDLAARAATLGRIYNNVGFGQLGLNEGWKSLAINPADYSAHRLLADSYSSLSRHEVARVSELLQSQLLQPINIIPVQPQLAETNLFILQDAGPAAPSLNEFNPLFVQDRLNLLTSGVIGGNNIFGDQVVLSGIEGLLSYSFGQFHYETDGFRENADQKRDIYNAFFQFNLSPDTNIQAEWRYSSLESGDLALRFNPESFFSTQRKVEHVKSERVGLRHNLSPNSQIIASATYQESDFNTNLRPFLDLDTEEESYMLEIQHLFHSNKINLISGLGYFSANERENNFDESTDERNIQHANFYLYSQINQLKSFTWKLGVSGDFFQGGLIERNQFNPKLGFIWNPSLGTMVHGAIFKTLKRTLTASQTIEPTEVGGFNQFFDDPEGTKAWRYGIGVNHFLSKNTNMGLEFSRRELEVPYQFIDPDTGEISEEIRQASWNETLNRAYIYWLYDQWLGLGLQYRFEEFERSEQAPGEENLIWSKTHRFPMLISLFHPSGISTRLWATYISQEGEFINVANQQIEQGDDQFWIIDVGLDYRLPKKGGIFSIKVNNLFDEKFHFQDTDPGNPLIYPDRLILARFSLVF